MLASDTLEKRRLTSWLVAAAFLAACSDGDPTPAARGPQARSESTPQSASQADPRGRDSAPRRVDPRTDGFKISLGEWAVTPEAPALRPGRVTFVVTNRGTMPHGFEIELEGDSSGHGSGDLFKAEGPLLEPGETAKMTVDLSRTGVYKIECVVEGHDDMGMEGPLEVSRKAPRVASGASSGHNQIAITNFSFDPPVLRVDRGTEVTWSNDDPTDHTVTQYEGIFSSEDLKDGDRFSYRFDQPGLFSYRCAIHPEMKGKVKVE